MIMDVKAYHVYKNAPACRKCGEPMRFLYTHVATNRSVWTCRDDEVQEITHGYPTDDDEPGSKSRTMFLVDFHRIVYYEYDILPGDRNGHCRTRENYLQTQDKQTQGSGGGSREEIFAVHALHI